MPMRLIRQRKGYKGFKTMHKKEVLGVALMCLLACGPLPSPILKRQPVAVEVSAQIGPLSAAETRAIAAARGHAEYCC